MEGCRGASAGGERGCCWTHAYVHGGAAGEAGGGPRQRPGGSRARARPESAPRLRWASRFRLAACRCRRSPRPTLPAAPRAPRRAARYSWPSRGMGGGPRRRCLRSAGTPGRHRLGRRGAGSTPPAQAPRSRRPLSRSPPRPPGHPAPPSLRPPRPRRRCHRRWCPPRCRPTPRPQGRPRAWRRAGSAPWRTGRACHCQLHAPHTTPQPKPIWQRPRCLGTGRCSSSLSGPAGAGLEF
jgi:hypothetical protein